MSLLYLGFLRLGIYQLATSTVLYNISMIYNNSPIKIYNIRNLKPENLQFEMKNNTHVYFIT